MNEHRSCTMAIVAVLPTIIGVVIKTTLALFVLVALIGAVV